MTDLTPPAAVPPALHTQLSVLAQQMVLLIIGSDGVGPFNLVLEVTAAAQFLEQARTQYTTPLVQGVLDILIPESAESSKHKKASTSIDMKQVDSAAVLDQLGSLDSLIADEAERLELKQFLLALANKIAQAAGPGLFASGKKVSTQEAAFLAAVKEKLGM